MTANFEIVDASAEVPADVGPAPVSECLATLTGVDAGREPIAVPPLVTVMAHAGLQPARSAR